MLLPYVMHWNKLACVERMQEIAQAMGVNTAGLSAVDAADRAVEAMTRLCAAVEIPAGLRSFGVPEDAIPAMATETARAAATEKATIPVGRGMTSPRAKARRALTAPALIAAGC